MHGWLHPQLSAPAYRKLFLPINSVPRSVLVGVIRGSLHHHLELSLEQRSYPWPLSSISEQAQNHLLRRTRLQLEHQRTLLSGYLGIAVSAALALLGLFGIGAGISLLTGRGVLYSGLRQVIFGLLAAGVTFGLGRILGVSLAG